jgi:hypothetical protein
MKKVSSRSGNGRHRRTKAGVMTAPSSWRFGRSSVTGIRVIAVVVAAAAASCGVQESPEAPARVAVASSALTAEQRLAACAQDPRVVTGLASARICAGADIFFRETFQGNGRTCGSCHPVENNFTIDPGFIAKLPQTDPLLVFKSDPNLTGLETSALESMGGILENVDDVGDFPDPTHKFVIRSVPHLLSLATSITRDENDPNTPLSTEERTGWGGDGGNLHEFLNTAIKQHYTKRLDRVEGVDFRFATSRELDLVDEFQRQLGRLNELDFTQVNVFDALAQDGKAAYLDPMRGRCQVCHANGGANFQDTGQNRNFDTGTRIILNQKTIKPVFDGVELLDGGFGGKGLAQPNVNVDVPPPNIPSILNGFGNDTFNTPPIIEAADTLPGFHTNAFGDPSSPNIEDVVSFYSISSVFLTSPAASDLDKRFGAPSNVGPDVPSIARFLRALNIALNLDMARQRLRASQTILNRFQDQQLAIQRRLIELAVAEIDDALEVLQDPATPQPFYPIAVDRLNLAKTEIAAALAGATSVQRQGPLSNAISRVENARDQIGSNITFRLGTGNLFF